MYGLMFHHFYDEKHPKGQGAIDGDDLDNILNYVGVDNIVEPSEWIHRAKSNALLDGELCLTFDDNLRCQFDVAVPVMEKYGLKGFWFIYTSPFTGVSQKLEVYRYFRNSCFNTISDFYIGFFAKAKESKFSADVEKHCKNFKPGEYLEEYPFYTDADRLFRYIRDVVLGESAYFDVMDAMLDESGVDVKKASSDLFMGERHIRDLHSKGHIIGLHSHSHPTLIENLSYEDQMSEYQQNYHLISEIVGENPRVMSHPCNSYNKVTFKVLRKIGIEIGFRSNMAPVRNRGNFEIPREDHANIIAKLKY